MLSFSCPCLSQSHSALFTFSWDYTAIEDLLYMSPDWSLLHSCTVIGFVRHFFLLLLFNLCTMQQAGDGIQQEIILVSRRRQWNPTPVLLLGKSHGRRSLVGCSPWDHKESDTTERLLLHFSLSCIGEGNGNPLQCSCLENPRDRGAWWAAVDGVTQSRTQLKRLSSSSSIPHIIAEEMRL